MRYLPICAFLLTLVLLGSCQKQEAEPTLTPPSAQPIEFRAYLQEGDQIRPLSRSVAGDPLANGYRISCLLGTVDYPTSPTSNYTRLMWNIAMNTNGTSKSPTEKRYFWADGDLTLRHTFVAYSENPTGTAVGIGNDPETFNGAESSHPLTYLNYMNDNDPTKQIDFLCTDMNRNIRPTNYVSVVDLIFQHRLARVMVQLIGTGGTRLSPCQAKITYKANTVKKSGTIVLSNNNANISYTSASYHSGTYNLGPSFTLPASANSAETAVSMGDFILLPLQTLTDAWASLTLTYTADGTSTEKSISIDLPALTLVSGMQNNIFINVSVDNQNLTIANVTLSAWNNKSATIDPNK